MYISTHELGKYRHEDMFFEFPGCIEYIPVFAYHNDTPMWRALMSQMEGFLSGCPLKYFGDSSLDVFRTAPISLTHWSDERDYDLRGVFLHAGVPCWFSRAIVTWIHEIALFDNETTKQYFHVPFENFRDYIAAAYKNNDLQHDRFLFAVEARAFDSSIRKFESSSQAWRWKIDRSKIIPLVLTPMGITGTGFKKENTIRLLPVHGARIFVPSYFDIELQDLEERLHDSEVSIITLLDGPTN